MKKILFCLLCMSLCCTGLQAKDLLSVENEFIKISVNDKDAMGRFALQSTFGDPLNEEDDNKELIYGQPLPWTSYTTFLINGTAYVFGDPDVRIERRSRKTFNYLPIKKQFVSDGKITSIAVFEDLVLTQELSFFKNPNTLVNDSMKITYRMTNNSNNKNYSVGLRVMLDTKLGENDGAPLLMGEQSVPTELRVGKTELYQYWQAFDSLVTPNIVAQGLLQSFSGELTLPDKIHLANWGSLADSEWELPYREGSSFIREGETQHDTALAMYYHEKMITSNGETSFSTVYGLGGLSLSPGHLSAGLTAAKQVPGKSSEPFLVVGYLLNASGLDSKNTRAEFTVPSEFTVVKGELDNKFDVLKAGVQKQIPLLLKSNTSIPKQVPITFTVWSDTFEKNSITRYVEILGQPIVEISQLRLITTKNEGSYYLVEGSVHNPTPLAIEDFVLEITPNFAYALPVFEKTKKQIPRIKPYERIPFIWAFQLKKSQENYELTVKSSSEQTGVNVQKVALALPQIKEQMLAFVKQELPKVGEYVSVKVLLPANTGAYQLNFDTQSLDYKRASHSPGVGVNFDGAQLSLTNTSGLKETVVLHFKVKDIVSKAFQLTSANLILEELPFKF